MCKNEELFSTTPFFLARDVTDGKGIVPLRLF